MIKKINKVIDVESKNYLTIGIAIKNYNLILNESKISKEYNDIKNSIVETIGSMILDSVPKSAKKGESFLFKLNIK